MLQVQYVKTRPETRLLTTADDYQSRYTRPMPEKARERIWMDGTESGVGRSPQAFTNAKFIISILATYSRAATDMLVAHKNVGMNQNIYRKL